MTFEASSGAKIRQLQSTAGINIPKDYLDLLSYYNGCILFKYQDLGGFQLLRTRDIESQTKFLKATYEQDWNDEVVVFCNIIGDGDFIGFRNLENGKYDILDCYHDELPKNWEKITDSFDKFLDNLIDSNGERYWLK